jgi:hypothetical protein
LASCSYKIIGIILSIQIFFVRAVCTLR